MYGSWGHYTEISKTQENIQYDMTHTQNPKKAKPIETEWRLPRENGEMLLKDTDLQLEEK